MNWLTVRLVDDWREARRWWSVRISAAGVFLMPLLMMVPAMPSEVQALLPLRVRAVVVGLYSLLVIALRLAAQKKPGA